MSNLEFVLDEIYHFIVKIIWENTTKIWDCTFLNIDRGNDDHIVGFDEKNFQSDEYQRPYHYLMHFENRVGDIPVFNRNIKETDKKKCLQVLTRWVYYKMCKQVLKRLTKKKR